jgi:hypothetical protein
VPSKPPLVDGLPLLSLTNWVPPRTVGRHDRRASADGHRRQRQRRVPAGDRWRPAESEAWLRLSSEVRDHTIGPAASVQRHGRQPARPPEGNVRSVTGSTSCARLTRSTDRREVPWHTELGGYRRTRPHVGGHCARPRPVIPSVSRAVRGHRIDHVDNPACRSCPLPQSRRSRQRELLRMTVSMWKEVRVVNFRDHRIV